MSETPTNRRERAARFAEALRGIREDRGKLAALRRGLSNNPRMQVDAWPIVASLGGDIGQPAFTIMAALYATHPEESEARNLGETCRTLRPEKEGDQAKNADRRFRRLLACGADTSEVLRQLPTWVRLAAGKGLGINYESLLYDLLRWPWAVDDIRVQWARSYWKAPAAASATHPSPTGAP